MMPVSPCRISNPFAAPGKYASRDDFHGPAGHHTGVDLGSAWPIPINGRLVRSVLPGEVVLDDFNDWHGQWVGVYNHDENLLVTYWHLSKRSVSVGDWVTAFAPLGRVGSTGNSTAPHLHVQVNRGRAFNYAGHLDPAVAFVGHGSVKRGAAKRAYRTNPRHPNA